MELIILYIILVLAGLNVLVHFYMLYLKIQEWIEEKRIDKLWENTTKSPPGKESSKTCRDHPTE